MTVATSTCCPQPSRKTSLDAILAQIGHLFAVRRERMELGDLDDHMLEDIGLTRGEALAEARRGLWDAPRYWRS